MNVLLVDPVALAFADGIESLERFPRA